ncbi:MAG: transglutaminase-like domain-containing protein [Oscillospiraceae bacterium]|nr:transglutaminase-like domain-containing protein [Oscillospiraceae bacterium]
MNKKLFVILLVIIISVMASAVNLYAAGTVEFDRSNLAKGVIGVKYTSTVEKKTKFLVQLGEKSYQYNIKSANKFVYFPFQLGNGEYTVGVFENIEGTKYAPVVTEKVNIKLDDSSKVFLNSIQLVEWSDKMNTVSLAKELSKNKTTEKEKIEVLYQYMVQQFKYDFEKVKDLQYDYIPVIDEVLKKKLGICYDYSAVLASMLRSQNIKCKLVMGYTTNVKEFHAWNEIFVDGKWVTVDTTYDSSMFGAKVKYSFEKSKSDYTMSMEY